MTSASGTGGGLARTPVLQDWSLLRQTFSAAVGKQFSSWMGSEQANYEHQLAFALGRLDEGMALLRYFEWRLDGSRRVDVLDVGCGNGGVALAFANCARYRVFSLDRWRDPVLTRLIRSHETPIRHTLGSGHDLPFADASFDLILMVDTIEHMSSRRRIGAEIMRVLRPGGTCFVSTAARLRYLLRPDPHYGVRGLVAFPNSLQRFLVNRVFRRRILSADGRPVPYYDVEHTFSSVAEIGRLFPGAATVEGVWSEPLEGGAPRFTRQWWRWKLKDFLFDHVVVFKGGDRVS